MSELNFEIFLTTPPGLEPYLLQEVQEAGFKRPVRRSAKSVRGGVLLLGDWHAVWWANLTLRGASKVLVRCGGFRAFHLAQLDKRARKYPWGEILGKGHKIKVEAFTNRKSKIYHAGAAVERIERAISEEFDASVAASMAEADIVIKARIDDNNVEFSIDSSGEGLHKRGHKQAMGKAPLRETMAASILRACEYDGTETVVDPMCGSGTFLIEAAEIAGHKMAGRSRNFAFEKLASYDADIVQTIREHWQEKPITQKFYGSDRNVNVIGFAAANAKRAGVAKSCDFSPKPITALECPTNENGERIGSGLVIVNPPYGARVGKKNDLFALYQSFGNVMRERFVGWRIGMITTEDKLAKATQLPFLPTGEPIAHGGLRVKLYRTAPLSE